MTPTHLSLFSGIGGIDLAADWVGFETIGQVEYADYPYSILEKHWPDVPKWRDVRNVTRQSILEKCNRLPDLISGGFPCQPHSLAGKRKASDDERDLWGEFYRIICEAQPRWVLAENVQGLRSSETGRFFGRVLRDLAEVGYNVGWGSWGACDIGAPHRRERIFILAYFKTMENPLRLGVGRWDNGDPKGGKCEIQTTRPGCGSLAYSGVQGCEGSKFPRTLIPGERASRPTTQCFGTERGEGVIKPGLGGVPNGFPGGVDGHRWPAGNWPTPTASEPIDYVKIKHYLETGELRYSPKGYAQPRSLFLNEVVIANDMWPAGVGPQHDWEPPRITTHKKQRSKRLTALGNAVVPQQVYPILKAIYDYMIMEGLHDTKT